jgi:glycosyltransferase involved in cell wall biosynthesis
MNKKISIIIPLYNKEREIKRTLDSVLSQTFQNFEIIIIDDYSRDGGLAIVKSYRDPRIFIIEQDHRGVSYSRNHGVDMAKSDYIAFLDADDEWTTNHLETVLRLIEKYPEAGMYTTAWKIQTPDGKSLCAKYKCIPNFPWEGLLPNYFKSTALGADPVITSVVVIPKKIFSEMGGFPEGYWYGEDVDLFGKIALKYPVAFSWELGALYHHDSSNRACDKKIPLDYEEPFIKTARTALIEGKVPCELREALHEYICRIEIIHAIRNIHAGQFKTAQIILKNCNTKWHYYKKIKLLFYIKLPDPLFLVITKTKKKLNKIIRKN